MEGELCPIEEDTTLRISFAPDAGGILLSACCDVIHVFPDERYTHVKVFDEGQMKTLFISQEELDEIAEFGIPITFRRSILRTEFDAWTEFMGKTAVAHLDEELDNLLD